MLCKCWVQEPKVCRLQLFNFSLVVLKNDNGRYEVTLINNFATLHSIQLYYLCCKVTGVACLVKDSNRKSYYIQIFDMDIPQRIWEQELYEEFSFKTPKEDVIVFEAELSMVALYFAEILEASDFIQKV